ncbi:Kinesin light chain 3 [Hondaea fermentalgiana]|uniref:Kinesin light chain 3 n=1 Tax=Hondaea fermentalgiana TaxID=2315210 RepID=A0A2R5G9Y2_9STRA|nr:Kinesin light chain 3 [Hondaea fermentalgiana]|eukprot:GBG24494.1 Kinesin light chain 3 [Hondaea fermentalgiana]
MTSRDAQRTLRLSQDRSQRLSQRQLEVVRFDDGDPRGHSLPLVPSSEVVKEAERKLVASDQSSPGDEVESLGDRHPSVATTLKGIAGVYDSQGRYVEALAYFEEALSINREALGDRHPDLRGSYAPMGAMSNEKPWSFKDDKLLKTKLANEKRALKK